MSEIVHQGIVKKTIDGKMEVELTDGLDCESCSVKGGCHAGETRDNKVLVDANMADFTEGEVVSVHMTESLAFTALFWAYVFPFIVLFGGLIILSLYMSEAKAGLISLAFLAVYYFFIYLNKNYFNKKFSLTINKLKHD